MIHLIIKIEILEFGNHVRISVQVNPKLLCYTSSVFIEYRIEDTIDHYIVSIQNYIF